MQFKSIRIKKKIGNFPFGSSRDRCLLTMLSSHNYSFCRFEFIILSFLSLRICLFLLRTETPCCSSRLAGWSDCSLFWAGTLRSSPSWPVVLDSLFNDSWSLTERRRSPFLEEGRSHDWLRTGRCFPFALVSSEWCEDDERVTFIEEGCGGFCLTGGGPRCSGGGDWVRSITIGSLKRELQSDVGFQPFELEGGE